MAKASEKNSKRKGAATAKPERSPAPSKAPKAEKQAASKAAATSGGLGQKIQDLKQYFEEAKVELKKVTWPSRKETTATSIAVLVVTIVMAIFLGLTDMVLSQLVQMILS